MIAAVGGAIRHSPGSPAAQAWKAAHRRRPGRCERADARAGRIIMACVRDREARVDDHRPGELMYPRTIVFFGFSDSREGAGARNQRGHMGFFFVFSRLAVMKDDASRSSAK